MNPSKAHSANPALQSQPCNVQNNAAICPHRARVIRQLFEAILFEGNQAYQYDGRWFTLRVGEAVYRARGRFSGFGRVRLVQEDIWQTCDGYNKTVDLALLVRGLPGKPGATEKLLQELEQTIAFCRWNQDNLDIMTSRRELSYTELESAIREGHTYHPCFKARSGFSHEDHAQYGPEAGNQFQLEWLAVRRQFLAMALDCDNEQAFWMRELGEAGWQTLMEAMQTRGISFVEYGLLPVHPWQLKTLKSSLQTPVSNSHIVLLGEAGDFYQASISLRTLLNVSSPHKANIKLPLNVVNSSSLRIIEPHSVCTAPVLSRWLEKLIHQDSWFEENAVLDIQSEYAGIVLSNDTGAEDNTHWLDALAPSLSVIFRDSRPISKTHNKTATHHQDTSSQAIPFVALSLTEADGDAFIAPWIKRYGVEAWVQQLIEVTVLPVWHLLVRHGIALETHAQNMTLLHDNGWPQKLIVRDFHESLEFVSEFLAAPELQPDFTNLHPDYAKAEPDRYYWMSSIEALRELLVDTLFVYNLSEIAVLLEADFSYSESQFWKQVDKALCDYAAGAPNCSKRRTAVDLYQPQIKTESLIRKKLSGQSDTEFHHTIPNSLYQIRGGAIHVLY